MYDGKWRLRGGDITSVNMASVEEDNKPQCERNLNIQRSSTFDSVYKVLDQVLNDCNVGFDKKVDSLVEAWKLVYQFCTSDNIQKINQYFEWVRQHTLNIVLSGKWKIVEGEQKDALLAQVDLCKRKLGSHNAAKRCKKLAEVIKDPWENATLVGLLNTPDLPLGPEEINFFSGETGYVVSMRLKQLCDSRCEDLALHFSNACLRCLRMSEEGREFREATTKDQKRFMLDIYIALLFKFNKIQDIINELKLLGLEEGLELFRRFTTKRVDISKVWKDCNSIAELAAPFFMTAAMMKPVEQSGSILADILTLWLKLNHKSKCNEIIPKVIRRIVQAADSAAHIYICCEMLEMKFADELKPFIIELYIRALTTDMNEMEKQKTQADEVNVIETSKRLANGFLRLADLLMSNVSVSRECVLTSFSLNPTRSCFRRLEAMKFYKTTLVLDTGQRHAEELIGENLGLTPQLCDDLSVVLSSPRYQLLSWKLSWQELEAICEKYLADTEGTKNVVKELKYLNIDYNKYKDLPSKYDCEHTGIEKGYEPWLEDSQLSDEDSDFIGRRPGRKKRKANKFYSSDSDYNSVDQKSDFINQMSDADSVSQDSRSYMYELPNMITPKKESNPEVLKSLRLFRPTLKRNKSTETLVKSEEIIELVDSDDDIEFVAEYTRKYDDIESDKKRYNPHHPFLQSSLIKKELLLNDRLVLDTKAKENVENPTITSDIILHSKNDNKLDGLGIAENNIPKPNPLQDMNPRVILNKNAKIKLPPSPASPVSPVNMNPKVVLDRIDVKYLIRKKCIKRKSCQVLESVAKKLRRSLNVLSTVPGLNSLEMIRPTFVQPIVQVVEIAGDRDTPTTTQTSTQVTPHIQRIGQPRPAESTVVTTAATSTAVASTAKSTATHPSALINVLSQQINRPAHSTRKKSHKRKLAEASESVDKKRRRSLKVLSNVPGLNSLEMMRPSFVQPIVQVVEIAGGRKTPTTTQTSTQVTPHIQRIGQPRPVVESTPVSVTTTTTTTTTTLTSTTKSTSTHPSTLINILSQQIIRPAQSPRASPVINIVSQQIIRPPTGVMDSDQGSSRIIATGQFQQLVRSQSAVSESNRIVQLICKSTDGKLIPVTSFPNRTVKVVTTTAAPVETSNAAETESQSSLPKFQQAFGKPIYVNNTEANADSSNFEATTTTTVAKSAKTVTTKPLGGVIYTRVPVGQTVDINIPSTTGGRGQVFRISQTPSDQISMVKETVICSKMSALLAAALQGKPKETKVEASAEVCSEAIDSGSDENSQSNMRVAVARSTNSTRIVKPVLQIPARTTPTSRSEGLLTTQSAMEPNLSSTTLEQLREFDLVLERVKERSTGAPPTSAVVTTEATNVSAEEPTQQRISVTYLNQTQKITCGAPVVVVSSYCSLQPAASPALSVTSQSSSSPCVTPAPTPTSSGKTMPKAAVKSSKSKSIKATTTHASKASPIPKPQQKPQEDEHTTQRIYDILAEYKEQLRNSPDLNNKPAPRRRSNPPTNPSQSSKRKKTSGTKKCSSTIVSDADVDDPRTMGSEDSSCGVVQISVQDSPLAEDHQPQSTSELRTTESSEVHVNLPPRQILLQADSSNSNQPRNLIIADSSVSEALVGKITNTAVLVPGNYIMPVSMVKGGQQIAVMSGGSKILATVPARSGPNMLLFQSFHTRKPTTTVPTQTVKYSTIQAMSGISSQAITGVSAQPPVVIPQTSHTVTLSQQLTRKKLEESDRDRDTNNSELLLTIVTHPSIIKHEQILSTSTAGHSEKQTDHEKKENTATVYTLNYSKKAISVINAPIATPVIEKCSANVLKIKEEDECEKSPSTPDFNKVKSEERVQSVLVAAGSSNGPMLAPSSTSAEPDKDEEIQNGGKVSTEPKTFVNTMVYSYGKIKKTPSAGGHRLDREIQQLCMQRKQAALERELRLQKSLSEECEDLGVDEPSTSDLFPEADLLFDPPSFDQSPQGDMSDNNRANKRLNREDKGGISLFSDDDNSSSTLRTDFLFEPEGELEYERNRQATNGQSSTSNGSYEDNTLIQHCASMSDVTMASPISESSPPPLNKYKYKYSNRKKNVCQPKGGENECIWPSSSEDTTGDEDVVSNKVLHVILDCSKKDDVDYCDDLVHSPSGRGVRRTSRSVKKMCSCCNGSQQETQRKRSLSRSRPQTPVKKAFVAKKR